MEGRRLVFALFLCAGAATANLPLLSSSAPAGIRLFESAVLTCNYSGSSLQFGDTVKWLKDGREAVTMSTVEPPWPAAISVTTNAKASIINVTAISATVGGLFTCVMQRVSSCDSPCMPISLSILLPVYGPPLAVIWHGANSSTLVLTASQQATAELSFQVQSFYNVSSSVSVTLGSRDISDTFVPTVHIGETVPTYYNVTFTSSISLSQSTDDGAVLNVTVAVPMYPPISSAVTIVVFARPNISCAGENQTTAGNHSVINCTVYSNPPATAFNWTSATGWSIVNNGTSVDSRLRALVQEGSRGYYTAVLNIFNMSNADYGSYSLDVTNDVGKSTQAVRIVPGIGITTTSTRPTNGACLLQRLHWTVAATALAIFGFSQAKWA